MHAILAYIHSRLGISHSDIRMALYHVAQRQKRCAMLRYAMV